MAFGGFFGGSSSGSDKPTPSEFSPSSPSTPNPVFNPSTSNSSTSPSEIKTRLQTAITQQSNILNAKTLISKINENCFDHCVPYPGSSLSSKEQGCLSSCMEKYIEGWNVVSRAYVGRLQREGVQGAQQGGGAGGMF